MFGNQFESFEDFKEQGKTWIKIQNKLRFSKKEMLAESIIFS